MEIAFLGNTMKTAACLREACRDRASGWATVGYFGLSSAPNGLLSRHRSPLGDVPLTRRGAIFSIVGKRKRQIEREIVRLRGSPAAFVGFVEAQDEKTALDQAIEQFKIRPEDQKRLPVLPRS